MDWLVDTNIILRAADKPHPSSSIARKAMKTLFRQGHRLCVARQSLVEAWVVATRPRDVNGFGYSPRFAAEGLSKIERLFYLLAEMDDIHGEWQRLVVRHDVSGKAAYDARLVAAMNIHQVKNILTFNTGDFARYQAIQVVHPEQVIGSKT
jgi:predicted nucleic acid-binding protein